MRLKAIALLLIVLFAGTLFGGSHSAAQSPFGVTAPQAPIGPTDGFLREHLTWIYQQQAAFYKQLTGIVKQAKEDGTAVWGLILLSFLYGVFHAAGPGHGKIVISSYMLANEQTLKRGIFISFLSSLMQAVVAVLLITIATFLLKLTSFALNEATAWFERGSFMMIALLGVYLLWQKGVSPLLAMRKKIEIAHDHGCTHNHAHAHHGHNHDHKHDHSHDHDHGECGCGGHAADPRTLKEPLSLKSAWAAVMSVGLRPCSGALIVLVFSAAQGLYWVGVVSTFAMAVGTGITVATLASIALGAKGLASQYLATGGQTAWAFKTIEILGASLLILLGATLFMASMAA